MVKHILEYINKTKIRFTNNNHNKNNNNNDDDDVYC